MVSDNAALHTAIQRAQRALQVAEGHQLTAGARNWPAGGRPTFLVNNTFIDTIQLFQGTLDKMLTIHIFFNKVINVNARYL